MKYNSRLEIKYKGELILNQVREAKATIQDLIDLFEGDFYIFKKKMVLSDLHFIIVQLSNRDDKSKTFKHLNLGYDCFVTQFDLGEEPKYLYEEILTPSEMKNKENADYAMQKQPVGVGVRYNDGKTRLELIPPEFIEEVGKVFTFGAKKYSVDNWKHLDKEQQEQIIGSLLRHILEYQKGNKLDSESGLSHLAHASCNLAMMIWFDKQKEI